MIYRPGLKERNKITMSFLAKKKPTKDRENMMTPYLTLCKMKDSEELARILMVHRTIGRSKIIRNGKKHLGNENFRMC